MLAAKVGGPQSRCGVFFALRSRGDSVVLCVANGLFLTPRSHAVRDVTCEGKASQSIYSTRSPDSLSAFLAEHMQNLLAIGGLQGQRCLRMSQSILHGLF